MKEEVYGYAQNKDALIKAALQRYEHNLWTPDRPGWNRPKCPRSEYRGLVGESGAADWLGIPQASLCLYSPDRAIYTAADMRLGPVAIEVKSGHTFNDKDFTKADVILFVEPVKNPKHTRCDHCAPEYHPTYSRKVLIKGWITEHDDRQDKGGYYSPTTLRNPVDLFEYALGWDVA